jgi:hypothetical protein
MDFGTPKELFTMRPGTGYAVWADGQRFLINAPLDDEITPPITVLLNWAHLR